MCGICERVRTQKVNTQTHTFICECEERKFYIKIMYNNTFIYIWALKSWKIGKNKRRKLLLSCSHCGRHTHTHTCVCIISKKIMIFPRSLSCHPDATLSTFMQKHAFHLFRIVVRFSSLFSFLSLFLYFANSVSVVVVVGFCYNRSDDVIIFVLFFPFLFFFFILSIFI